MRNAEKDKLDLGTVESFRPTHVLVHYDEVALKGRNRESFEKCLQANVRRALEGAGASRVRRLWGRIVVDLDDTADHRRCGRRLSRVFGVTRFSPVIRLAADPDEIAAWAVGHLRGLAPRTFAIASRRANKQLPFTSMEVNRRVGRVVQDATGWPVSIENPDLTVHVHLVDKSAYVGFERQDGPGGLPTGSTGRVAALLSGGIDSPVAAHQIQRRGAEVVFVHFHSYPRTSGASLEKVREIVRILLPYGHTSPLCMVPFADVQQKITMECPAALRVILYRRFMVRAAETIARTNGALALVTGESLGQVASQTLENIRSIDAAAGLPVLRPLVGTHKLQIVDTARRIGTYETSIEPHDDCCSFLMPRHPATRSTPEQLDEAEGTLETEELVRALVESSTVEELTGVDP